MEIELEKSRNELLHRTNVLAKIRAPKTPARKELLKKVAAMLGAEEKLIVIDKIVQNFGEKISTAYLKIYDNVDDLKRIELAYKIKRTGGLEEPKKEEKPKDKPEPVAEEKPAEEPKEKVEEKPKETPKEEPKEAPKEEEKKE